MNVSLNTTFANLVSTSNTLNTYNTDLQGKQNTLVAGSNIIISGNTISAINTYNWSNNNGFLEYGGINVFSSNIEIDSGYSRAALPYLEYDFTENPIESTTLLNIGYGGTSMNATVKNISTDDKDYTGTTDGLIAWYKFDGNFLDSTTNGYHITNYGATFSDTSYKKGSHSVSFTSSQYAVIPINTIKVGSTTRENISISFWVKKNENLTGYRHYISVDPGINDFTGSIYFGSSVTSSSYIHVRYGTLIVNINTAYDNRATGIWNHYVLVLKKNGTNANITFYVNGTKYTAYESTPWIELASLVRINRWMDGTFDNMGKDIDDLRFYNRVLTDAEVLEIYGSNFTGLKTNLIAWYKFDSATATDLTIDSSGNNRTLTTSVNTALSTERIKNNTSVLFNGSAYFEIANTNNIFTPLVFTLCTWIKAKTSGNFQTIASARYGNAGSTFLSGWTIYISPNERKILLLTGAGKGLWDVGIIDIPIDQWFHLCITMSNGNVSIYINGNVVLTKSFEYNNTSVTIMRIGAVSDPTVTYYLANGTLMSDFRMYDKVLSASELRDVIGYNLLRTTGNKSSYNYFWNGLVPVTQNNANIILPKLAIDPITASKQFSISYWMKLDNLLTENCVLSLNWNESQSLAIKHNYDKVQFMISNGFVSTREYPPASLASATGTNPNYTSTINGLEYGNGTYVFGTSTMFDSNHLPSNLFNKIVPNEQIWGSIVAYNSQTGDYTGLLSTTYNTTLTYSGEWIQIKFPVSTIISSYVLCGQNNTTYSTAALRGPKDFVLLGSNDGSVWSLIDQRTGITNWGIIGAPKTFDIYGNQTAYSYYRIVINKIQGGSAGATIVSLSEWKLLELIPNQYPPASLLTATSIGTNTYSSTLSGLNYGNGSYEIRSSSQYSSWYPLIYIFDYTNNTEPKQEATWISSMTYDKANGSYIGTISTTYNTNLIYNGEWVQIKFPIKKIISSYLLVAPFYNTIPDVSNRAPKDFILLGSNDGLVWFLLDQRTGITNWGNIGTPKTFSISNNNTAYSYYRLIINKNQSQGLYTDTTGLNEWRLFESITTNFTKYPRELMTSATKTYTDGTVVRCTDSGVYQAGSIVRSSWTLFDGTIYTNVDQYTSQNNYNNTGDIGLIKATQSTKYFNNDTSYYGEYIIIDLGEKIILNHYIIYPLNSWAKRAPRDWRIYATNDDASYTNTKSGNWVLIDTETGISGWADNTSKTFTLSPAPTVAYRYYAMIVNRIQSNSDEWLQFTSLELYSYQNLITKYETEWIDINETGKYNNFVCSLDYSQTSNMTMSLYKNGSYVMPNKGGTFTIPYFNIDSSDNNRAFIQKAGVLSDGVTIPSGCYLEDYRLYDKSLTYGEVQQIYTPTQQYYNLALDSQIMEMQTKISYLSSFLTNYYKVTTLGATPRFVYGDYWNCEFTSTTAVNTISFPYDTTCDLILVGGGGGGGFNHGGGGGAGAVVVLFNVVITKGTYTIVVGAGGTSGSTQAGGGKGKSSSFHTIVAEGGGGSGASTEADRSGGSGAGADAWDPVVNNGVANANTTTYNYVLCTKYGNNGGANTNATTGTLAGAGGSGGGAGSVGLKPAFQYSPAKGGDGIYKATNNGLTIDFNSDLNITCGQLIGTKRYFGGGGGNGNWSSYNGVTFPTEGGEGGFGGGGGGGRDTVSDSTTVTTGNSRLTGVSGTANTGGGGGGGGDAYGVGGAGGSGIVIVRWKEPLIAGVNY